MKQKTLKLIVVSIVAIFLLWLVGAIYLTSQANAMVFNNSISWAPVPNFGYRLEFAKSKDGKNFSIWEFQAKQPTDQYLIYLHGNAGRLVNFYPELTKKANVISPAYPGYHESEGDPNVQGTYDTAVATYNWLVDVKKVPENKITIFGHSMGGSPAIYLASQKPNAKKLIIVNTFSSIQSMCFTQYNILCAFAGGIFNSAKNAESVKIPVRQYAYKGDTTVPFEEGKKLYDYFKNSNDKKFVEMDNFTHSYPDFEEILNEI